MSHRGAPDHGNVTSPWSRCRFQAAGGGADGACGIRGRDDAWCSRGATRRGRQPPDLREGLGPEFQDFDFDDLNPRRFVQKHLLDDMDRVPEQTGQSYGEIQPVTDAMLAGAGGGARATLVDGEDPPFDVEAT